MFFSKKLKLITYATCLSIIILCIVECLSAMWFGTIAKNEYKKQFTFFSDSLPITVRNYSYQQGLFTSKEVVDFNINSGVLTGIFATSGSSESVVSIKLVTTVYNGIFAGLFTGHLVPTIAVAKSAIELQPSLDKTIKQIYANKEFLSWSNVMYLTRGGEIVISSPAVQYEEAVSKFSLRTSGFTFTSDYDSNYNGFNNTFKLGSLELGLNDVSSFKVSNIEYVSNSHYSANSLRVGSSKVSIDQIVLDNTDKILPSSFSLGSLASNILSINIGDFLPSSDSNNFDLQHLSYHNYSNDDGKYFSTDISVKLDKILLESTAAGPFVVKAKLSHVLSN